MNKLFLTNNGSEINWKTAIPLWLFAVVLFIIIILKIIPIEFIKRNIMLLQFDIVIILIFPIFSVNFIIVKLIPNILSIIPSLFHIILSILLLPIMLKYLDNYYLFYGIYFLNILLIGYDKQFNNPSIIENIIVSLLRLIYFAFFNIITLDNIMKLLKIIFI
jgi:hypothetical protein